MAEFEHSAEEEMEMREMDEEMRFGKHRRHHKKMQHKKKGKGKMSKEKLPREEGIQLK